MTDSRSTPRPGIDLSIIIVSWNVRDLLAACLESIIAAPLIIVAPNGTEYEPDSPSPGLERGLGGEVNSLRIINCLVHRCEYLRQHFTGWSSQK